jgi:tripartite-type tricarboxylate transporter receptor subunit TctC
MPVMRVMQMAFMLVAIGACAATLAAAAPADATYPSKPVRLIVPFSPGGTNDILARMIGQHLTEKLGKTFIVDNRPGADGVIATDIVSKANPDGYTLLVLSSAYAMNPAVRKLPYDPKNAVDFILKMGDGPTLLSVGPALPVKSVKELFAATQAKPGEIIFGTSGGFQYFATALLKTVSRQDFNIVLYKGTAPSLIDIIGGQTHAGLAPIVPTLPHLRSGKMKALAAGTIKRSSMFPDLPTLDELGYKGFHASNWYTIATTPGTPKAIVSKLYDEISAYMRSPATTKTFTAMGGEVDILSTEEVRKFVAEEMVKWRKVAIDSGMPRETN